MARSDVSPNPPESHGSGGKPRGCVRRMEGYKGPRSPRERIPWNLNLLFNIRFGSPWTCLAVIHPSPLPTPVVECYIPVIISPAQHLPWGDSDIPPLDLIVCARTPLIKLLADTTPWRVWSPDSSIIMGALALASHVFRPPSRYKYGYPPWQV
jgi:hypothetical protein